MKLSDSRKYDIELKMDDFRLEVYKESITIKVSLEFIKLLQKDGYGQNAKPGTSTSEIVTKTRIASLQLWEVQIEVLFDDDEIEDKTGFIKGINQKLNWLSNNREAVSEKLKDGLLELKNDLWLSEDETPISSEAFKSRLQLNSIIFSSDESFDLIFSDDGLFGGHEINLPIDSKLKLGKPEL